ncbi:head-tail connector protein [Undibacterium sp. Di24W]|uniref:head-tail connector protein n=1 Tax=Undibacterium sp. Di24W TaxID=3413033 RepID=UPI003BF3AF07
MSLKLYAPATLLPITLAEAKLHLRVEMSVTDEDALITALIGAATQSAEHIMGRAVMPQKWQLMLDGFDDTLFLSMPPVSSVDSVKYINTAGTLTTLSPSVYQVVIGSDYTASIVQAYGQVWPAIRSQPEAVQIIFSTGYADAASVPELIKSWIKLCLGALYENRELESGKQTYSLGFADRLLDRYKVWSL